MRRSSNTPVPWWSEPGPDACEFCLSAFHVEVGFYCWECDRPVCPVCVVTRLEQKAVFCPECLKER